MACGSHEEPDEIRRAGCDRKSKDRITVLVGRSEAAPPDGTRMVPRKVTPPTIDAGLGVGGNCH